MAAGNLRCVISVLNWILFDLLPPSKPTGIFRLQRGKETMSGLEDTLLHGVCFCGSSLLLMWASQGRVRLKEVYRVRHREAIGVTQLWWRGRSLPSRPLPRTWAYFKNVSPGFENLTLTRDTLKRNYQGVTTPSGKNNCCIFNSMRKSQNMERHGRLMKWKK